MQDFKRLWIMNDLPFPTAVNRTANDYHIATDRSANLIHLGDRSNLWNQEQHGITLRGRFSSPLLLNKAFNYFFPSLSYEGMRELIKNIEKETGIIHYSNQSINPIRDAYDDIVYVNDNPISVTQTDLYSLSPLRRKLTSRHYKKFSRFANVIVNSNYVKKSLEDFGFDGKLTVINPLGNRSIKRMENKYQVRQELNLPQDKKLILSVTNGVKRKNLKYAEEVMNRLDQSHRLVRVGDPLKDSITFNGVSDEVLAKIYSACDVLFFPSLEEGFGIPVIEAFRAGIPVVLSDIDVMHEVACDAGVFVDPYSISGGVRGLKEVLDSPGDLVERGKIIGDLHSPEIFNRKVKDYYQKVLQ